MTGMRAPKQNLALDGVDSPELDTPGSAFGSIDESLLVSSVSWGLSTLYIFAWSGSSGA
eukprot:SAG22_NODE_2313_length_2730_cov_331.980236_3_plen_59_part_00